MSLGSAKRVTLAHVGSGKYSDVFAVFRRKKSDGVMMKVSFYRDSTLCDFVRRAGAGDLAGARRAKRRDSIMVGGAFARLTARLVATVSPHFVLVYCEEDCKEFAPRLGALLRERVESLTPLQRRFSSLCFMEPFDSNLTQFLTAARYTEAHLRAVVFQVLYTLAALQALLPGFRHNDLSTNNVLVKRLGAGGLRARYLVGGRWFAVTGLPVLVALSDYDFLHVPGRRGAGAGLSNERVTNGKYRVDGEANRSYDVHFFLKSVLKCVVHRHPRGFAATRAFLRALPLREDDRQDAEIRGLDPVSVLRAPYFAPLAAAAAKSADWEFSYSFAS